MLVHLQILELNALNSTRAVDIEYLLFMIISPPNLTTIRMMMEIDIEDVEDIPLDIGRRFDQLDHSKVSMA